MILWNMISISYLICFEARNFINNNKKNLFHIQQNNKQDHRPSRLFFELEEFDVTWKSIKFCQGS